MGDAAAVQRIADQVAKKWTDAQVDALIDARLDDFMVRRFNSAVQRLQLWQTIAAKINEACPPPAEPRTAASCPEKWDKMNATLRVCVFFHA